MKKIYQKPVIELVIVEIQHIMATGSEQLGVGATVNSATGAEARGGDWDDDEY